MIIILLTSILSATYQTLNTHANHCNIVVVHPLSKSCCCLVKLGLQPSPHPHPRPLHSIETLCIISSHSSSCLFSLYNPRGNYPLQSTVRIYCVLRQLSPLCRCQNCAIPAVHSVIFIGRNPRYVATWEIVCKNQKLRQGLLSRGEGTYIYIWRNFMSMHVCYLVHCLYYVFLTLW
jgi:hypothetical protein